MNPPFHHCLITDCFSSKYEWYGHIWSPWSKYWIGEVESGDVDNPLTTFRFVGEPTSHRVGVRKWAKYLWGRPRFWVDEVRWRREFKKT